MDLLYHYTDFAALDGIIRNSELRLNNILNMNDAEEMKYFMKKICLAVMTLFRDEGDEDGVSRTGALFQAELSKEFIYSAYAACFSEYRDDAAQWERYGYLGRGAAIGFDRALLQQMTYGALTLREVFYEADLSGNVLVRDFYEKIRKGLTAPELQDTFNRAWISSAVFKHPSFACENEVRLLVSPFEQSFTEIAPQYHITRERIKKYYPLDLNRLCSHAGCRLDDVIGEIIIGPESTQSVPILQDYLKDIGHPALAEKVIRSECPLRRVVR